MYNNDLTADYFDTPIDITTYLEATSDGYISVSSASDVAVAVNITSPDELHFTDVKIAPTTNIGDTRIPIFIRKGMKIGIASLGNGSVKFLSLHN